MIRLLLGMGAAVAFGGTAVLAAAPTEEAATDGRLRYEQRCGGCHLEGGFGTRVLARRVPEGQAMLEQREVLPAAFVTLVVRRGLGSMPQIREAELSDADLAAIAAYLETGQ